VCLGAPLARIELQTVFRLLFERIPTLRLAVPADEVPLKDGAKIFGVKSLPLTW
jgi:cytochrome P450